MKFGAKIKEIRREKGMTQESLEKRCGIKREYLSRMETGSLPNTTVGTLCKIADGLGVSVVSLLNSEKSQAVKLTEDDISRAEKRGEAIANMRYTQELDNLIKQLRQTTTPGGGE